MISIGNLELGHLIDTMSYLDTPIPKSLEHSFIIKSWGWDGGGGQCDYCVSPSSKNWIFGLFILGLDLGSDLGTCWDGGLGIGLGLDKRFFVKYHFINFALF